VWLDDLVELLFPLRCAGCDAPGTLLCKHCSDALPLIDATTACRRCGAPADGECSECRGRTFSFASARAVAVFMPPMSDLIRVYKDAGERRVVPVMADLLASSIPDQRGALDAIVPVPPRPSALRARGFDHIGMLAEALASKSGLPVSRCLVAGDARDQRGLGRQERADNARQRFSFVPCPPPARVLLLDDVFTTGATLDACADRLIAAGVSEVRVLTLARATDAPVLPACPCRVDLVDF